MRTPAGSVVTAPGRPQRGCLPHGHGVVLPAPAAPSGGRSHPARNFLGEPASSSYLHKSPLAAGPCRGVVAAPVPRVFDLLKDDIVAFRNQCGTFPGRRQVVGGLPGHSRLRFSCAGQRAVWDVVVELVPRVHASWKAFASQEEAREDARARPNSLRLGARMEWPTRHPRGAALFGGRRGVEQPATPLRRRRSGTIASRRVQEVGLTLSPRAQLCSKKRHPAAGRRTIPSRHAEAGF